ncbi:MAG: hypothetical protein IT542_00380 [Rubellimicrobium sp.]|nr:hypothetical protein [Rubellimicrobium sp.]
MFRAILFCLALLSPALGFVPANAQNLDPAAPCGRDDLGRTLPCDVVDPNALEVQCATSANWQYCLPYHQRACQTGFALACNLASLGQNCQGGDPRQCQYYVDILRANTACLSGDQAGCAWLRAQGL